MILQIRTLHALCFLVVDCSHINLGFMVHLKRLFTRNVSFSAILMHLLKKYYQYVRNAVFNVCAKHVPVWGKRGGGEREGYYGETNYLDMSF